MFYNSLLGVSGLFTTIDPDNTGYLLAIVFFVLRYMDSDYPFGIFKFFLLKGDYCKTYPVLSGSIVEKRPDTPRRLL
jgi:hypothetical protein